MTTRVGMEVSVAVGEVVKEPRFRTSGEVDVEGEVLGELEGLEAVNDDRFVQRLILQEVAMENHAVAAESGKVTGDGGMADAQDPGHLAQAGSLAGPGGNAAQEIALL